jgi:hypothetical protein
MTSIRFYFDEDCMDHDLVDALRIRRVDITTALEQDMVEQPDQAHLDFATAQGRVLYSFNIGDYYHLHTIYLTEGKSHAGIILAPQQRYTIGQQMRRLLKLAATLSAEEMQNRLEFLSHW